MVAAKEKAPKVLADHRRAGKKFIPPFIAELGPLSEVRWVNDLVPELVWRRVTGITAKRARSDT